jgi:uncharacterized protein YndB with AHSA1/START domain
MKPNPSMLRRELVITRILQAPRDLVFQAWTDPAHLAQWFGPKGYTIPACEVDARPGGALRIVMQAPDGTQHPMKGVFREVIEPERLVFTNIALDAKGNMLLEGLTTVTFADEGAATKMTLTTSMEGAAGVVERMLDGMEAGWSQSFDKLAEYLHDA